METPRDLDGLLRDLLNGNKIWNADDLAFFRSLVKRMESGKHGIMVVVDSSGLDYAACGDDEEILDMLMRAVKCFVKLIKEKKV